jgi:predicted choloylglycine hydrolase
MYHPRLKGNHYEMGQKMGTLFKKANVKFSIKLDPFQIKYGKESGKLLKQLFPEAASEIKGITNIIGYDNEIFTAWMMCMGCCLDLRDEESHEVRGCTAFSFESDGQFYHGRDNDLPPFLKKTSMSIYYVPKNSNRFILNTSSFVNGEEGLNEYGLVAAMTFVQPILNEIKPGINSVFLVRYILEKCKTVNEGINSLRNIPIASSCNIIMTDKTGNMAVVECNPNKINIRHPEKNKNGECFIVTVNHFTSKTMWKHDASNRDVFLSRERYQTAYNALISRNHSNPIELTKDILSGRHGFICQYDKTLDFDTIWSSVFDITNNRIYRAEGNPLKTIFLEDRRLQH